MAESGTLSEGMDWHTRAARLHADPEPFFPKGSKDPVTEQARQTCHGCLVRTS